MWEMRKSDWGGGDNKEIVKQWTMNNGKKNSGCITRHVPLSETIKYPPQKENNSYSFKGCNDNQDYIHKASNCLFPARGSF